MAGPDFIEEQRPAIGGFNPPDLALVGAGKGTLFVAEQFGLDQVFGNRSAVDRYKRFAVALGLSMQRACDQLFAGSAFAPDQHRRFGGGQFAQ